MQPWFCLKAWCNIDEILCYAVYSKSSFHSSPLPLLKEGGSACALSSHQFIHRCEDEKFGPARRLSLWLLGRSWANSDTSRCCVSMCKSADVYLRLASGQQLNCSSALGWKWPLKACWDFSIIMVFGYLYSVIPSILCYYSQMLEENKTHFFSCFFLEYLVYSFTMFFSSVLAHFSVRYVNNPRNGKMRM